MTEEEYFRKTYPDYCYGERLLNPYWDFFQDGVEFGERQSGKKIEELKTELAKKADTNHSLVEQMAKLEEENAELKVLLDCKNCSELSEEECEVCAEASHFKCKGKAQLTKAVELLKWALHSDPEHDNLVDFDTKWKEAEQFLKEME